MCGRSALFLEPIFITNRLGISTWIDQERYQPSYNVSPSYYQPVITRGLGNNPSQSDRQAYQQPGNPKIIRSMKWGLIPSWAANDPKTGGKIQPVNIRDDSLTGKSPKPMFKNTRNTQRCLVVAQGFYEWKREGKAKVPYFSTPADQEDKDVPFVLFGALYDRVLIAGHEIYSYAIITTPANDQFNVHDRMPLIFDPELDSEAIEYWLDPKTPMNDRIKNMMAPFKRKLTIYQVPDSVNRAGFSHPSMMKPLNAKSTLLGFFQNVKSLEGSKPLRSSIKAEDGPKIKKERGSKVKEEPIDAVEIKDESSDDDIIEVKDEEIEISDDDSEDNDLTQVKLGKRSLPTDSPIEKRKIKKEA